MVESLDIQIARVTATCVKGFDDNRQNRLKQIEEIKAYMERTEELHSHKYNTAKVPGIGGLLSAGGMILMGVNPFNLSKEAAESIGSVFRTGVQGVIDSVIRMRDATDISTEGKRSLSQIKQQQLASNATTNDNRIAALYKAFLEVQNALTVQTR